MCKGTVDKKQAAVQEKKDVYVPGQPRDDFFWEATDEPHASRRKMILAKYPEVKKLFGHCPLTKYMVAGAVATQIGCAYFAQHSDSWLAIFAVAYIIGGTANHMMMMAMHELSHNLGFKKMIHNRLLALAANLPLGIPSAVSFKRYHMEHHRYQGEDGIDVDIPTVMEGKIFRTALPKLFFVCFQVLFYAFRPLIVNPKTPSIWEGINFLVCAVFDYLVYRFIGPVGLFYLFLSTLLGAGAHPVAGHFIAEHYVFVKGHETYSYYGILNWFTFNVGYHNEHHDFPYIPGTRLPLLRAMAPEFYDPLPKHNSWVKVMWDYVFDSEISAFSRVKRKTLSNKEFEELKKEKRLNIVPLAWIG